MNGLLIAVAVIFLICAIVGYYRGFIKITVSLAATIASIVLVMILNPYVSDFLLKTIPIEKKVQEKCIEMLMPEIKQAEAEGVDVTDTEGFINKVNDSRETQISLIENAGIPEIFKQLLLENNNDEIYKSLGVTKFSEYVGSYLAKLIANIVGFLISFVIVTIAVRIAIYMLGIIEKLPVIGGVNRLAGGVIGLGTGLVIVWILFIVITLMYDTDIGRTGLGQIEENQFLTILQEKNVLLNIITKFKG